MRDAGSFFRLNVPTVSKKFIEIKGFSRPPGPYLEIFRRGDFFDFFFMRGNFLTF